MTRRATSGAWLLAAGLCLAGLCLGATLPAAASENVLGPDGTDFRLLDGAFGELFPEAGGIDPANPVLAIEAIRSDGTVERWLVPSTETGDRETSASMVFEDSTETIYLVWETRYNAIHPLLLLTGFDTRGGEWTEVIEITGGVFARKGSPQIVVTRETGLEWDDEIKAPSDRTILHLTWWEEAAASIRNRYAPIIIEEGKYLGHSPIIDLDQLLAAAEPETAAISGIEDALRVQPGKNSHSVVIGFLEPVTQNLVSLEIETLPPPLGDFAEEIRAQIILIGTKQLSRSAFAREASIKVHELGTGFHDAARLYLADQVYRTIDAAEDNLTTAQVEGLGEIIRAQIILIGARIQFGGFGNSDKVEILRIDQPTGIDGPSHYLKVTRIAERPAPPVDGPVRLFLSETGRNLIVAWDGDERVTYLESAGEEWSAPREIELATTLDRDAIYRMLEQRVRAD